MEIIGLLSIDDGLLCKKIVLGKQYQTEINGVSVTIVFPDAPIAEHEDSMNYVGMSNPLCPPEKGKTLRYGKEKIFWGYPMYYPQFSFFVKHVLLIAECEESEMQDVAQRLYSAIGKWEASFTSFCRLCTKQNLDRERNDNEPHNLSLLSSEGYIQNNRPLCMRLQFSDDSEFLSDEQVQRAISFASSGKELLLEYQMLLSAYVARRKCQNRQAIVDACSAMEICLVNKIKSFCIEKDIDPDLFLKKYRSLGDRFRLVEEIDVHFPVFDYDRVIVSPRNDIAHNRNVYPSDEVTDSLIEEIEMCLKHYHTAYY